jgi:hypothetical protein
VREDLNHEIDIFCDKNERSYWKRALIYNSEDKTLLKMYAERVDNQSHRGLTIKNFSSVLGKQHKHSFYELVRGIGF